MVAPLVIGAGLQLASGLFNSRSARRAAAAAENQARQRQAQIQQYGRDALGRSQEMASQLPTGFRAYNVRTGFGGWNIDPTTGTVTAEMSPEAKAYQDWAYGASGTARQQLGDFNRQQFAQQEYDRGRGLLQEGRSADLSNLVGMLQRKGIAGFGQTPVGGTSTIQSNPLLNSLFDRQNRQDLELLDRSYGAADTQMDRLTRRATGLFEAGYGLNDDLNAQLDMAYRLGERERAVQLEDFRNRQGLFNDQEQLQRLVALGGVEDVGRAQQMGTQSRLASNTGLANSIANIGGMFLSKFNPGASPSLGGGSFSGGPSWMSRQDYGQMYGDVNW